MPCVNSFPYSESVAGKRNLTSLCSVLLYEISSLLNLHLIWQFWTLSIGAQPSKVSSPAREPWSAIVLRLPDSWESGNLGIQLSWEVEKPWCPSSQLPFSSVEFCFKVIKTKHFDFSKDSFWISASHRILNTFCFLSRSWKDLKILCEMELPFSTPLCAYVLLLKSEFLRLNAFTFTRSKFELHN